MKKTTFALFFGNRGFFPGELIADARRDLIAACERAIHDNDPAREALRAEYGRKSSWDSRVEQIEAVLHSHAIL